MKLHLSPVGNHIARPPSRAPDSPHPPDPGDRREPACPPSVAAQVGARPEASPLPVRPELHSATERSHARSLPATCSPFFTIKVRHGHVSNKVLRRAVSTTGTRAACAPTITTCDVSHGLRLDVVAKRSSAPERSGASRPSFAKRSHRGPAEKRSAWESRARRLRRAPLSHRACARWSKRLPTRDRCPHRRASS
jgi:hypothetical protein